MALWQCTRQSPATLLAGKENWCGIFLVPQKSKQNPRNLTLSCIQINYASGTSILLTKI